VESKTSRGIIFGAYTNEITEAKSVWDENIYKRIGVLETCYFFNTFITGLEVVGNNKIMKMMY